VSDPGLVITIDIGGSAAKAYAFDVVSQRAFGQVSVSYPELRAGADRVPSIRRVVGRRGGALASLVQKLGVPGSSYLGVT